jgi:hypothetical protein
VTHIPAFGAALIGSGDLFWRKSRNFPKGDDSGTSGGGKTGLLSVAM